MTEYRGTAEAVRIESDERGWEIHLLTDEGWHVYNIHAEAETLYDQTRHIGAWLAEREDARAHIPPAGGMTREEILDVYRDDPGKQHTMLEGLS